MTTRTIAGIAGIAGIAALLLQGCSNAPRFEKNFGASVRANLTAQTVDPRAGANTNPVNGLDGPAARAAHERYQRSFVYPDSATHAPLLNTLGGGK